MRARARWRLVALLGAGCEGSSHRVFTPPDASVDAPVDAPDAGPSAVGRACSDAQDQTEAVAGCAASQSCFTPARGFPGGYCTQACRSAACPADAFCVAAGAERYCLRRCASDDECRVAEGYVCQHLSPLLPRGCIPNPAPVGLAPPGTSCTDSTLTPATFVAPAASVTFARENSDMEVDPSLAIAPDGTALLAYAARNPLGEIFGGVSIFGEARWAPATSPVNPAYNHADDPVLCVDRSGVFYAAWRARADDHKTPLMQVARSQDHGASWTSPVQIDPPGRCTGGCDPPVLVRGASGADPGADRLHALYIARSTRGEVWLVAQRSDDGGRTFSPPVELNHTEQPVDAQGRPTPFVRDAIGVDAVADDHGTLHVAWAMLGRANARGALGDRHNLIRYARSDDGVVFGGGALVSLPDEAVVTLPPRVAVVGATVGVLYVSGESDGRWDLVLATTTDGARWQHRRVNDDHARCATHAWAALAGDPARGVFHALWLDNRTGEGGARYARCAADGAVACGVNEAVAGEAFHLSTTADPNRWHGHHAALALDPRGGLWAAWSDTRTGGPALYAAHADP